MRGRTVERNRFRLTRDFALSIVRRHYLVRKSAFFPNRALGSAHGLKELFPDHSIRAKRLVAQTHRTFIPQRLRLESADMASRNLHHLRQLSSIQPRDGARSVNRPWGPRLDTNKKISKIDR